MNKYTMLSTGMLYDQESHILLKPSDLVSPYTVDIPFYMWTRRRLAGSWAEESKDGQILVNSTSIMLRDLTVTLTKKFGYGYIKFVDGKTGFDVNLTVETKKDMCGNRLQGAWLSVLKDDDPSSQRLSYIGLVNTLSFIQVPSLGKRSMAFCQEVFSYGVRSIKWRLRYHKKNLERQQYVFLCGFWGILLNDDMSFNSLVSLRTVSVPYLDIDKVLYTVDPSMVKTQMLIKYAA